MRLAVHVAQRRRRRAAAAEAFELALDPPRARAHPRGDRPGRAALRRTNNDARVRMHFDAERTPARAAPQLVADGLRAVAFEGEELAHALSPDCTPGRTAKR